MNRKQFCAITVLALTTMIAGCGGGSDNKNNTPTIDNPVGNPSADLSQLTTQPYEYQSAYINRGTSFLLSWPSAVAAPRSTQVNLVRFLEGRGDEPQSEDRVSLDINGSGAAAWAVKKRGNLDVGGVYYLDALTAVDHRKYAFVVEGGRAAHAPGSGAETRGEDVTVSGGGGNLGNMTVLWPDKRTGSVGISRNTAFTLQFPAESSAPSRFSVRLRRYQEARGTDTFSNSEQRISVSHDAGTNLWTVRRRDNFQLDGVSTYILEVNADGDPQPRSYAFITGN